MVQEWPHPLEQHFLVFPQEVSSEHSSSHDPRDCEVSGVGHISTCERLAGTEGNSTTSPAAMEILELS